MRNRNLIRLIAMCICACTAIVCAVLLTRYALDFLHTRHVNQTLAAQYHEVSDKDTETATPLPTREAVVTAVPEMTSQKTVIADKTPSPTFDPFGGYPHNRFREVSAQFRQLQKTNKDICGWITIGNELDQAVVQRDNEYYLTRDYTGKRNANGAIFLDEQIELWQRPTCYILYGHNMKTGAMFGMLHKYDALTYLRDHAIITFNTEYEDGQFAVFAAGTINLIPGSLRFADYYALPDAVGASRSAIIDRIKRASDYSLSLDVSEEDQLLILITCVGDDTERRFVAARRLREGESAASLNMTYMLAEHR